MTAFYPRHPYAILGFRASRVSSESGERGGREEKKKKKGGWRGPRLNRPMTVYRLHSLESSSRDGRRRGGKKSNTPGVVSAYREVYVPSKGGGGGKKKREGGEVVERLARWITFSLTLRLGEWEKKKKEGEKEGEGFSSAGFATNRPTNFLYFKMSFGSFRKVTSCWVLILLLFFHNFFRRGEKWRRKEGEEKSLSLCRRMRLSFREDCERNLDKPSNYVLRFGSAQGGRRKKEGEETRGPAAGWWI